MRLYFLSDLSVTQGATVPRKTKRFRFLLPLCCVLTAQSVVAQKSPDAGSLLREQPKPSSVVSVTASPLAAPALAEPANEAGTRISVKAFSFQGASLISSTELAKLLQAYIGKELRLPQLEALAANITAHYAQRGYLARVVLPPQEVKDGAVTYQIIEGKLGSLNVTPLGKRIDSARVQGLINYRLSKDNANILGTLGEAMTLLNEQPGVQARATLSPGHRESEFDVNVNTVAGPLFSADISSNNSGSKGTGTAQVQGSLSLNNPSGHFDAATLTVNANEGSRYFRGDYSASVNDSGMRLGINASAMNYNIVEEGVQGLDSHGTAHTVGLRASFPWARRDEFNLNLIGAYDQKKLIDKTSAGETGDRKVSVVSIGLEGFMLPASGSVLHGGKLDFDVSLNIGDSMQNNDGARALDRVTRRVEGAYSKLSYSARYAYSINDYWSMNTSLRGQSANSNLDSTEGFTLGGPNNIRAYAVGEAVGDEGWLFSLSASRKITDQLAASLFYDAGGITLNHDTWADWNAGNLQLKNRYTLSGVGLGLDWRFGSAVLNASIASPLGTNPDLDTNGKNVDGSPQHRTRGWISLRAQF